MVICLPLLVINKTQLTSLSWPGHFQDDGETFGLSDVCDTEGMVEGARLRAVTGMH